MKSHEAWQNISSELNHTILDAVWRRDKKLYRALVQELGRQLRRRVPSLLEMPRVDRHRLFQPLLGLPQLDMWAQNALMCWLGKERVPMLCAFLSSLGIEHDEEGCAQTIPESVEEQTLKKAVDQLYATFPEEEVSLYLSCWDVLSGKRWENLDPLIRKTA